MALRSLLPWLLAAVVPAPISLHAQGPSESNSGVQRVLVPIDKLKDYLSRSKSPATWPVGDWQPIDRRDFDALLQAADRKQLPQDVWIQDAEYRAIFAEGKLHHGTLRASLKHFGSGTQLVSLDPVRLSVSELRLGEADAVWGTTATGELGLLAGPSETALEGRWTLAGRVLPRSVEFDVGLLPATVSRMLLQVPDGHEVSCAPGHVEKSGPAETAGWWLWQVDLGGHARCRLRIDRIVDAPQFQQPVVLENSETSYVVRESGVEIRQDFQLEVLRAPVARLRFLAPPGFEVHSVTYGAESSLPWRSDTDRNDQRLDLDLFDPLLGRGRPISFRGFMPNQFGRSWLLERLSLRNGVSTGDRVHVRIDRPLVLRDVDSGAFHQTRMLADDEGETFTFERIAPGAMPAVDVDFPPAHLSSTSVSHLNVEGDAWQLTANVTWTGRNGSTFVTRCHVPADWNVTDVQVPTDDGGVGLTDWKVVRRRDSEQEIVIEFPNALEPGHEKTVQVVARRTGVRAGQQIGLPAIYAADVLSSEVLLAVTHSSRSIPRTVGPSTLFRTPAAELPDRFRNSALLQAIADSPQSQRSYFSGRMAPSASGEFSLDLIAPSIDVDANVVARLASTLLTEQLVLKCRPIDGPVDRLVVQLNSDDAPFTWELRDKPPASLSPRRLDNESASNGDEAANPDVHDWELRFAEPQSDEFTVTATRSRLFASEASVTLAFVPQARRFRGNVELRVDPGVNSSAVPTALTSVQDATAQKWSYQDPAARLSIRSTDGPEAPRARGLASLSLYSVIAPIEGGHDVHRAQFVTLGTEQETFAFQLPNLAKLIDVRVDGRPAQSIRKGDEWLVPQSTAQPLTAFEIHYETPSQAGRLWTARQIAIPRTRHDVVNFQWEFVLPPGQQLTEGPQGVVLADPLPNPSLLKRVFGPLGRGPGERIFNPFLKESWRDWLRPNRPDGAPLPSSSDRLSSDSLIAQGWTIWHAVAPEAPAVLTLKTWNAQGAQLCAWAALFGSLILGLGFRIRGGAQSPAPNRSLAAYWFGGCVVVALLAPAVYAEIAGGCVCGWLLAVLLPHGLLRNWRFAHSDKHGIRLGSTVSVPEALATSLLIGMLWVVNVGAAQESSTIDAPETTARSNDATTGPDKLQDLRVVVPVGRDFRPAKSARFVYVTQGVLDRLRQLGQKPNEHPRYLILSADYAGTVDAQGAVVLHADYRVAVLDPIRETQIRLPIAGAHLSGPRECLVDGKPATVVRDPHAGAFLVDVPAVDVRPAVAPKPLPQQGDRRPESPLRRSADIAYRVADIRLELRPIVADAGNRRGFEVTFPSIGNGSLSLEFPRTGLDVAIAGRVDGTSRNLFRSTNASRLVRCPLGWAEAVSVSWSDASNGVLDPSAAVATVEAACLVEARPSRLTLNVRADYILASGTVDYLVWRIPRNAVPRRVMIDDKAARFTMTDVRGPNADCMIELPEPRSTDFTVAARFTLPLTSVRSVLSLPALDLFAADPAPGTVQLTDFVEMTCGLSAASNDRIVDVKGGGAEDLPMRMIVPESLVAWARELGIREPQTAFELARPTRLEIQLAPLTAERTVHLRQTGTVDANSLAWTAEADVETSTPGVFQHVLEVDERLDIESVSVTEDEAERLVRWSPQGNRVVLFLSGRTTGLQTVKLVGRLPCPPGEEVTLPSVRFVDAETVTSTMSLQHGRDVDMTIVGSPDEKIDADDAIAPLDDDESFRKTLGPFDLSGNVAPMQIQLVPPAEVVRCEAVSLLELRSGGRWDLTQVFDFGRKLSVGSHVALVVPPDLTERIEFLPEGLRQEATTPANGSMRFVVTAGQVPTNGYRIVATARHLQPPQDGSWNVPHVTVQTQDESAQYLVLSPAGLFQFAEDGVHEIDDYDLPEWFPITGDEDIETADWDAFRIDDAWPPLVPALPHEQSDQAQVPLFETRMWLTDTGKRFGETELLLRTGLEGVLRLTWPHTCHLRGLTIDGRHVPTLEPEGGSFTISLNPTNSVQMVNVYWDLPAEGELTRFGTMLMTYPSPKDLTVGTSLLTFAGPETRRVMPRGELAPHDPAEHALDRLSALVAALRGGRLQQHDRRLLWSDLQQESRRLVQRLTRLPTKDEEVWNSRWQRYRKLTADLDSLKPAGEQPESAPTDSDFPSAGTVSIPAAERMLLGRLPPGDPLPTFSLWVIDQTVLTVLTATLCLLVVLPVARAWVGVRRSWRTNTRGWTAWALLALIWWTCLTPSVFGMLLLPCAAWYALRRPQATLEPAEFVLRPSAVTTAESTSGLQFDQLQ